MQEQQLAKWIETERKVKDNVYKYYNDRIGGDLEQPMVDFCMSLTFRETAKQIFKELENTKGYYDKALIPDDSKQHPHYKGIKERFGIENIK